MKTIRFLGIALVAIAMLVRFGAAEEERRTTSRSAAQPYRHMHTAALAANAPTHASPLRHINVNIATVAQINPAYSSAYVPDGYDSATQTEILAEIRQLRGRVDAAAGAAAAAAAAAASKQPMPPAVQPPYGPAPAPAPAPRPKIGEVGGAQGLSVFNAKCAQCHQAGKLAPDQRFTLLDMKGNLATLTAAQKFKVLTKAYSGQMPPPTNVYNIAPLTDAEFAAIVDALQ